MQPNLASPEPWSRSPPGADQVRLTNVPCRGVTARSVMRDGGTRSAEVTRATVRVTVPLLLTNCPALIGTMRPSGRARQDDDTLVLELVQCCLLYWYI